MDIFLDQDLGRDISTLQASDAFADLTSVSYNGVTQEETTYPEDTEDSQVYVFHFDGDLTDDEVSAVLRRATSNPNEETIHTKMRTAIAVNNQYLALSPPTNAQILQQVNRLTREVNALIYSVLKIYDSTDGT